MNLEEKATQYADNEESGWIYSYNGYINGYKECKSDLLDFLKANPKISTEKITEYLNSL